MFEKKKGREAAGIVCVCMIEWERAAIYMRACKSFAHAVAEAAVDAAAAAAYAR